MFLSTYPTIGWVGGGFHSFLKRASFSSAASPQEGGNNSPKRLICVWVLAFHLRIEVEQFSYATHRELISIIIKGRKGAFQHI
eukprot:m.61125 g.61125  ORF g.61125 m.61125 type:complete len:83 (-) comp7981_c1_seq1:802-1050(-)